MVLPGVAPLRRSALRPRDEVVGADVYDFTRPVQLSREHARVIEGCMEAFARQAATVLTSTLRAVSHVEVQSVAQMTYAEYVDSLLEQTHLAQVALEPLPQPAIWQVPIETVMTWVDLLLGGHGRGKQPDRSLTDIETAVVSGLLRSLVAELGSSFDPIVSASPALVNVSYRPRLAHFVPTATVLVVVTLLLRQGERETQMSLALPFASILPHLSAQGRGGDLSEREHAARLEASVRLAAGIDDVPVDVGLRCRPTSVAPTDLVGLQVGDVVRLRHPADAPLDVVGGDVRVAQGTPGTRGQSLACLIIGPTTQERC